jgi:hypothetical protein
MRLIDYIETKKKVERSRMLYIDVDIGQKVDKIDLGT